MPTRKGGVLILNPPYGERIPVQEIEKLYKEIGDKLKKDYKGYNAWIITSSPEAVKSIGLRPSRRIHLLMVRWNAVTLNLNCTMAVKKPQKTLIP